MSMIEISSHVEITVRRQNGAVEVLDYTAGIKAKTGDVIKQLTQREIDNLAANYKAAGQELLDVKNVTKMVESPEPTEAEKRSDAEHKAYVSHHNSVARMSAGGESFDRAN